MRKVCPMKRNMKKAASSRSTVLRLESLENRALLSAVGLCAPEPLVFSGVSSEAVVDSAPQGDVVDLSDLNDDVEVVDAKGGSLVFNGTDGDDQIAISTETQTVEKQVFAENPYVKTLERYEKIYGKDSKVYNQIETNLNKAYEQLSKVVVTKTSTLGVVNINGEISKFIGAKDVTVNAGDGADSVQIDSLHYDYKVTTEGDVNELNFTQAGGRLNLDLGNTHRQCAIVGDGGTLKLRGAFSTVDGTQFNDRVVGTDAGLTFFGNGGSDSVTLVGGENSVFLFGPRQSVVARGNGKYNVEIWDADYSVINADGVKKDGETNVKAEASHATVFGGRGHLIAEVEGNYATINGGATSKTEAKIIGKHASVTGGSGRDRVYVTGDKATITTNAGDDYVSIYGSQSNVRLGNGDDMCLIKDGESGKKGGNYVWGDAGDDAIVAMWTAGANYLYAGLGNDMIVGGTGKDYIYANSGDNILIGLDGADSLYGGCGRDVLVSSTTDQLNISDSKSLGAFYDAAYQSWVVDEDLEATIQLLGEHCVKDDAKDSIYRGGGRGNLVYSSKLDADFENALERSPFKDVLFLD